MSLLNTIFVKTNLCFLFILVSKIVLPVSVFGQFDFNYQEGIVIKQTGDTLYGEIDNEEWDKNPEFIIFRTNEDLNTQRLTPSEIRGFFVDGSWYKSKKVSIDETPLKVRGEWLVYPSIKSERVFLKLLVEGPVKLYQFKDSRDHFFISDLHSVDIWELISHEYVISKGGNTVVVTNETEQFKTQLRELKANCNDTKSGNIYYDKKLLQKFVLACNEEIKEGSTKYAYKFPKPSFGSRVFVGLINSNFHSGLVGGELRFYGYQNITFGYTALLILPGNMETRRLYATLQYQQSKFNDVERYTYIETNAPGESPLKYEGKLYDTSFQISQLKLSTGFEYQFWPSPIRPFVTGALSLHALLKDRKTNFSVSTNSVSLGGNLGIGLEYGRFSLALQREYNYFSNETSIMKNIYLTARVSLSKFIEVK